LGPWTESETIAAISALYSRTIIIIGLQIRLQRLEILPQRRILSMMRGTSKAALKRPNPRDAETFGKVLRFEPRRSGKFGLSAPSIDLPDNDVDEFARFEQEQDEPINYRQRMMMNIIALAILALLVGLGVWIADTIADLQREQDCLMQGRSNCAPIEVPAPLRD
jgi:hypothetical protein